jgi:Inorganic pyrophosphatase
MPQWRQDHPNNRLPTRATDISAMGHNRPLTPYRCACGAIHVWFSLKVRRSAVMGFGGFLGMGEDYYNYGFVPHTLSDDGDPIDVLVANTRPIVPGAVINVRPIGVLKMEDDGGGDEKIIAVPLTSVPSLLGTQSVRRISVASLFARPGNLPRPYPTGAHSLQAFRTSEGPLIERAFQVQNMGAKIAR